MLRLSKLTDYATVVLTCMAREPQRVFATFELAEATGLMVPTVSKILKQLVKAKILGSSRGARGGYFLLQDPARINLAVLIDVLEGPIALTECSQSRQLCRQAPGCSVSAHWQLINRVLWNALATLTLADLANPAARLAEMNVAVSSVTAGFGSE